MFFKWHLNGRWNCAHLTQHCWGTATVPKAKEWTQNGTRKSEGLPHLRRESATQSKRQSGQHKPRRLIAQVAVDRFRPEPSEPSAHAAAVCLKAITPLTASRLKWKRTGMHCGCNSVESCLRLLAPLSCDVENAVPARACADRHNFHPGGVCRSGKLWSGSQFWDPDVRGIRLEDMTWDEPVSNRRWKVLILDPLWRINVFVWFRRHTGDREWFGVDPGRKGLIVFRLRRLGSRFTTSLRESNETRHSWRYLKKGIHIHVFCLTAREMHSSENPEIMSLFSDCRVCSF